MANIENNSNKEIILEKILTDSQLSVFRQVSYKDLLINKPAVLQMIEEATVEFLPLFNPPVLGVGTLVDRENDKQMRVVIATMQSRHKLPVFIFFYRVKIDGEIQERNRFFFESKAAGHSDLMEYMKFSDDPEGTFNDDRDLHLKDYFNEILKPEIEEGLKNG